MRTHVARLRSKQMRIASGMAAWQQSYRVSVASESAAQRRRKHRHLSNMTAAGGEMAQRRMPSYLKAAVAWQRKRIENSGGSNRGAINWRIGVAYGANGKRSKVIS